MKKVIMRVSNNVLPTAITKLSDAKLVYTLRPGSSVTDIVIRFTYQAQMETIDRIGKELN